MVQGQLYTTRKFAVRGAMAHFGRLAAEGSHFTIKRKRQPNGMFRYFYEEVKGAPPVEQPIAATYHPPNRPDKPRQARGKAKGTTKPAKAPKRTRATAMPQEGTGLPSREFDTAQHLGMRPGTKTYQAVVLYGRRKGATLEEVKEATGSPQLNVLKRLEGKGHEVKRIKQPGSPMVYRLKVKKEAIE